jgi:Zn-dependent peptidase ImmA (M78 family)
VSGKLKLARKKLAEGTASLVLRELKLDGLRIDPEAIATVKGILVQPRPDTAQGVSGMLVKAGDEFGIMYATNIRSRGFQRFSIAHELGHYCIDGHAEALLIAGAHYSHANFASHDPYEQEADYFAAALLMPELAFRREMNRHDAGLTCIENLAKACETSLTSTAIRYANLTRDGVAVILSKGEEIDYCFMSEGLKEAKGITWLKKGTPIPAGTVTSRFVKQPENVRIGARNAAECRLNDWMDGDRIYRIVEEVVGLGSYGRTLTVLTCATLGEEPGDDDEQEDEDLAERWTPRFRR